jgi:hypothetical protein
MTLPASSSHISGSDPNSHLPRWVKPGLVDHILQARCDVFDDAAAPPSPFPARDPTNPPGQTAHLGVFANTFQAGCDVFDDATGTSSTFPSSCKLHQGKRATLHLFAHNSRPAPFRCPRRRDGRRQPHFRVGSDQSTWSDGCIWGCSPTSFDGLPCFRRRDGLRPCAPRVGAAADALLGERRRSARSSRRSLARPQRR